VRVAQEAARIISEHGVRDFRIAKEKAASRIGVGDRRQLPRNTEIETALRDYQALFAGDGRELHLRKLREASLEAMQVLAEFRPRLVGAVLNGLADEHSDVQLHLFSDVLEEVELFLASRGIQAQLDEKRLKTQPGKYRYYPVYRFVVGKVGFEAWVFPVREIRQPPLSPIDGAPMQRADCGEVREALHG
jgi:hypothetical protein